MPKFQQKPLEVEAYQYTGQAEQWQADLPGLCWESSHATYSVPTPHLHITVVGQWRPDWILPVGKGDWVVHNSGTMDYSRMADQAFRERHQV